MSSSPGSSWAESYVGRLRAKVGGYPLIIVSSRIVIERADGKVLLEKRTDFDVWAHLGGACEDTEPLLDSVIREAYEESGLTIRNPIPFGYASNPAIERVVYAGTDVTYSHAMMFLVKDFEGELRIQPEENCGLAWFAPDEFPKVIGSTARTMDALARWKATGQFQLL